jgi:hypothetical protein
MKAPKTESMNILKAAMVVIFALIVEQQIISKAIAYNGRGYKADVLLQKRTSGVSTTMRHNVRRYISVADYEEHNCQIINNLNTRTNDTRNTKTAIEYTCCYSTFYPFNWNNMDT